MVICTRFKLKYPNARTHFRALYNVESVRDYHARILPKFWVTSQMSFWRFLHLMLGEVMRQTTERRYDNNENVSCVHSAYTKRFIAVLSFAYSDIDERTVFLGIDGEVTAQFYEMILGEGQSAVCFAIIGREVLRGARQSRRRVECSSEEETAQLLRDR